MIMAAPMAFAQNKAPKTLPANYYVEKTELQLSAAINKYRTKNGLGELQLSPSLCFVARTHLNDMRINSKSEHGCSLNSWSDKGNWKPCCFKPDQKNLELMTSKPNEIIGFRGKGYEIVVKAKKGASAKDIMNVWLKDQTTQDFLMNAGKWSNRNWQSMGVSIYHDIASIWASEMPDRMTEIPLENDKFIKSSKIEPANHASGKSINGQESNSSAAAPGINATKSRSARVTLPEQSDNNTARTSTREQHIQTKSNSKSESSSELESSTTQYKGTSYFLIHSSYTSLQDAMKAFEKLKKDGQKNLVMIDARGKYRVALGIYTTKEAANMALQKNAARFDHLMVYIF
ncbi:MAG: SPOR domain-containing protein [Bacteroidota bacterium]|nr:SPOR domain-containing protein [Bacteroidota bacterium]